MTWNRKPAFTVAFFALSIFAPWTSPPAATQDFYYDGRVPFLIRRPVTELALTKAFNHGEFEGGSRTREGSAEGQSVAITMSTSGFVYHPALVTYNARINQSFKSDSYRSSELDTNQESDNRFFGYSLETHWLRQKLYNFDWSISRDQNRSAQSLMQPEALTETTRRSGLLDLKYAPLPTRINFGSTNLETSSYYPESRTDDFWNLTSVRNTEGKRTDIVIRRNETSRRVLDRNTLVEEQSLQVRHSHQLVQHGHLGLNFDSRSQDMDDVRRVFSFANSNLSLQHPASFRSNWNAAFGRSRVGDDVTSNNSLAGNISHQLYENLSTSIGATRSNSRDASSDELQRDRLSASVNYRRRIPWGSIQLSKRRTQDTTDDERTGRIIEIFDESYTFNGISSTIVLTNTNIDLDTIFVTSADRLTVYLPGIDYTVDEVSGNILITRDSLAGIGDDETVLVSYQFLNDLPTRRLNDGESFSATLSLGRLSLGFSKSEQQMMLLEGIATDVLPWSNSRSFRASYDTDNANTYFQISKNQREHSDYEQRSLTQRLRFRPNHRTDLDINIQAMEIWFKDKGIKQQDLGVSASATSRLGRSGNLSANGFLKKSTGDQIDRYQWGLQARYNWIYGAWRPSLVASYNNVDDQRVDYRGQGYNLRLELRRTFR